MDALDYLRSEIKTYYPESSELQLAGVLATHRRFNFYFKIISDCPFLLYLNSDGEGDRFTLKCLEFTSAELLTSLIEAYPHAGTKIFNIGKPKLTASFIYRGENKMSVTDLKGPISIHFDWNNTSGKKLMECVDPEIPR